MLHVILALAFLLGKSSIAYGFIFAPTPGDQPPPKGKRLMIIIGLLVVLALVAVGIFINRRGN
jgi:hypothetical protein